VNKTVGGGGATTSAAYDAANNFPSSSAGDGLRTSDEATVIYCEGNKIENDDVGVAQVTGSGDRYHHYARDE
jgi:hypothetical protein